MEAELWRYIELQQATLCYQSLEVKDSSEPRAHPSRGAQQMRVERQQAGPQPQAVSRALEMMAQRAARWLADLEASAPQAPAMADL